MPPRHLEPSPYIVLVKCFVIDRWQAYVFLLWSLHDQGVQVIIEIHQGRTKIKILFQLFCSIRGLAII
jgi:hypothetical protein